MASFDSSRKLVHVLGTAAILQFFGPGSAFAADPTIAGPAAIGTVQNSNAGLYKVGLSPSTGYALSTDGTNTYINAPLATGSIFFRGADKGPNTSTPNRMTLSPGGINMKCNGGGMTIQGCIDAETILGGGYAVEGTANVASGNGVRGISLGGVNSEGVHGESDSGIGVSGIVSSGTALSAVSTSGTGVNVLSTSGTGVNVSTSGTGVNVVSTGGTGLNVSTNGNGVHSVSTSGMGVYGQSVSNLALRGQSDFSAIQGTSTGNVGAFTSGVYGEQTSTTSAGQGIAGRVSKIDSVGVYGDNLVAGGLAGYFHGNVTVTGTLSKGAGSFMIDHPLDPANKVLRHSFVESPDMKNVYDGIAVLDAKGEASVELPNYFDALNRDFRYQLTNVGAYAPTFVAEEIQHNHFKISGGRAGMKVSWQVTGIRKDVYAEDNRIVVEEPKKPEQRGKFYYSRDPHAQRIGGMGDPAPAARTRLAEGAPSKALPSSPARKGGERLAAASQPRP